jgi:ankyrin repeat protein
MFSYEDAVEAIKEVDVARLEVILKEGDGNLFGQDKVGNTLLHHATNSNLIMKSFLNKLGGYDDNVIEEYLNVRNNDDMTAIEKAIGERQHKIVELLASFYNENDFPLDVQNKLGETPLHKAVKSNDPHAVEILIKNGSDPFVINKHYESPLNIAVKHAETDQHSYLAIEKSYIDRLDAIRLGKSVENLQKYELDRAFNLNDQLNSNFQITTKQFFEKIDVQEKTVLDTKTQSFFNAVAQGLDDKISSQLKDGVDINSTDSRGRTALHYAVQNGNDELVNNLLERAININKADKYGNTALHYAADKKDEVMVEKLLALGASPNIKNYLGETPIFRSAYNQDNSSIKHFLEFEAKLDIKNVAGHTANDIYVDSSLSKNPTPLQPTANVNMNYHKEQVKDKGLGLSQ